MPNSLIPFSEELDCINDFLQHAAKHGMAITMLSSALRENIRVTLPKARGFPTFGDHIESILRAGGAVQILLWNTWSEGLICDQMMDILYRYATVKPEPVRGRLGVRLFGTEIAAAQVPHFLLCHTLDGERPELWRMRVELPDALILDADKLLLESKVKPSIRVDGADSFYSSKPYLSMFNDVFRATSGNVKHTRVERVPAVMAGLQRERYALREI